MRVGEWVVHFDGLCEPMNPGGVSTYGVAAWHEGARVHEEHGLAAEPGPDSTSNVAEFVALIRALAWLEAQRGTVGACPVVVRGDSRLAVETVAGRWNLKSERLLPFHALARDLLSRAGAPRLEHVPRDQNQEADRLSRLAYHEAMAAHPEWARDLRGRRRS